MPVRRRTLVATRRRPLVVALVALGLVLVAACGNQQPTKYGSDVEKAFVEGCTGASNTSSGSRDSGTSTGSAVKLGSEKDCRCVYDGLVKNVPFATFTKANSSLQDNPNQTLPAPIAKQVTACQASATSPSSGPTTTTSPAGGSTTTTSPGGSTPAPASSSGASS